MRKISEIEITQSVDANAVFFIAPKSLTDRLLERYFFYPWDEERNEMRLVCSWDTSEDDIRNFIDYLRSISKK
jgi:threonine aldolase